MFSKPCCLAALVALCAFLTSAQAQPRLYTLENDRVRLSLDERASVVYLGNQQSAAPRNYIAKPLPGFWSLIFRRGASLENVVEAKAQTHRLEQSGNELRIFVDKLRYGNETLDIRLRFTIALNGDELSWRAKVENRSDAQVTELFFPTIGAIATLGATNATDDLIWPNSVGFRYQNVKSLFRPQVDSLTAIEEPVNRVTDQLMELTYPWPASMAWYEFTNGREGIYFGAHDPTFLTGSLRVMRPFDSDGALSFGFAKFPFVAPGETWESAAFIVSPHNGDWHTGAEKYRRWADGWRQVRTRPDWVNNLKGMFLVILKQQYGDRMWRYDEIPALYKEAKENGMDTVALFGWTEGGHDNQYPDYFPDPVLGGADALRKGLQQVQAAGGNTILYCQGQLVDVNAPYYRAAGERLAAKNIWGSVYFEQYNKTGQSSLLKNFSRKLFAPICPVNQEWLDLLTERGKELLAYGATGLIYDQIGGKEPYLCFDASHPHAKPSLAFPLGRQKQLSGVREAMRRQSPNAGFMVELLTDIYAQHADVIHGWGPGFAVAPTAFPQMYRYTFPDVVMTARQQAPRADAKQVNFALAYGLRFELEVRYRADMETIRQNDKPHLKEYLRQVSALRDRYWKLLGTGRFLDDRGVAFTNQNLNVTSFENENRRAVVVWNNTAKTQTTSVNVPGYRLVEARGIAGELRAAPLELQSQQVAVLIYER